MLEYEMFRARERELLHAAAQERAVKRSLDAERAEAARARGARSSRKAVEDAVRRRIPAPEPFPNLR